MLGFILGTKSYSKSINESESIEETELDIKNRLRDTVKLLDWDYRNKRRYIKFDSLVDAKNWLDTRVSELESIIIEVEKIRISSDYCYNKTKNLAISLIPKFKSLNPQDFISDKQIKKESSKSKKVKTIWKPW